MTGVNASKIAKKVKNKAKKLNHVKYYTCKYKYHYFNKCFKKLKTINSLSKHHANNWQKWGIRINIFQLISYNVEKVDKGSTRLKK